MKKIFLLGLTIFYCCFLFSQKFGSWRIDSVLIGPPSNYLLFSPMKMVGVAKQKDFNNWEFFADNDSSGNFSFLSSKVFIPPSNLFPDCVFLNPASRFFNCSVERKMPYTKIHSAESLRFYCDTSFMHTTLDEKLASDHIQSSILQPYFQPFYFRKCEVSNKEYREFTNWVRDSIARVRLNYLQPNGKIDWTKKIDWANQDIRNKTNMFLANAERFWHVKEIDTHQLVYKFAKIPSEYAHDTVGIYPDTLSWTNDFTFSFNEPMTNMYCWHPAYDNYPVVGVNYWQCLAFLEWKSKMLQQQMNKNGKHFRVVCALPKEREWDFASTAEKINDTLSVMGRNYFQTCDASWMTDLKLSIDNTKVIRIHDSKKDSVTNISAENGVISIVRPKENNIIYSENPDVSSPYREMLLGNEKTFGDMISDGWFHTAPVSFDKEESSYPTKNLKQLAEARKKNERYLAHYDSQSGIYYLDGNVSEWMREDLDSTWRPIFLKHLPLVNGPYYDQFLVERTIENYYYKQLPAHGKLIRGCNWFDERFSWKYGKNTAGQNAKTFEDPNKDHCTVGFRYVIYVYPE